MKFALLTFHRAYNYGAVLQCYALNRVLKSCGVDCEVIDYFPSYFKRTYFLIPSPKLGRTLVKTYLCRMGLHRILAERNRNFEKFINTNISLSRKRYSEENISDISLDYDAYITGSDQVFSDVIAHFDPVFFLYLDELKAKRKYSYAASIGKEEIKSELASEYRNRLRSFKRISVREKGTAEIMEHILGFQPEVVCDPTLLLNEQEWLKICGKDSLIKDEYIFMYYVKQPQMIREYVLNFAREKHMQVVCLESIFAYSKKDTYMYMSGKQDKKDGVVCFNSAAPDTFLNLIKNAKYVFTSSFHGTVFSIIFHKQFLAQTRWEDGSINSRVNDLLELVGLDNRVLYTSQADITQEIDWLEVDKKINYEINKGREYIKSIIQEVADGIHEF